MVIENEKNIVSYFDNTSNRTVPMSTSHCSCIGSQYCPTHLKDHLDQLENLYIEHYSKYQTIHWSMNRCGCGEMDCKICFHDIQRMNTKMWNKVNILQK